MDFAKESGVRQRPTTGDAGVRKLEARLRVLGPMKRTKLARIVDADRWPDGAFDEAVSEGITQGKIWELPLDWLKASR